MSLAGAAEGSAALFIWRWLSVGLRGYCPSMSSLDDRPAERVADGVDAALEEEREELAMHAQQDAERDAKLAAALEKAKNIERST
jgi:hypothetical protein